MTIALAYRMTDRQCAPYSHIRSLQAHQQPSRLTYLVHGAANLPQFLAAIHEAAKPRVSMGNPNTHRGARTHGHKVNGLALCRLS